MMPPDDVQARRREVRQRLLDLNGRREHSRRELERKLLKRGFPSDLVRDAIDTLADEGLLSDARFVEAFVRSRLDRGQGPLKIVAGLRERGVDDVLIDTHVGRDDSAWFECSRSARERRFGPAVPTERREVARQARFLEARGFTSTQVRAALRYDADTD